MLDGNGDMATLDGIHIYPRLTVLSGLDRCNAFFWLEGIGAMRTDHGVVKEEGNRKFCFQNSQV